MKENLLNNNMIAHRGGHAAPRVLSAIKNASAKTGVNFAYLMDQAAAESSFDSKAKSRKSSATGLYQFIESTWLNMVKKYGDKHGLGQYADMINDNGKVTSKAARKEILDLRKDPEKAAVMAAEYAAENKRYLQQQVGGKIGPTELYLAHFLGAGGAAGFLKAYHENPLTTAADIFPDAARSNYNVFYDRKTGEARSLAGIYDMFAKKFGNASAAPAAPQPDLETQPESTPVMPLVADNNTVDMYVMKPFGQPSFLHDSHGSWPGMPSRGGLLANPADLMMLTDMKSPHEEREETETESRRARYVFNQ